MSMHLAAWCTHHHPLHLAPSIHPQTPPPATNSTPHPRPPPPPHLLLRAAIPPLLLEPLHPRRLLRRLLLVVLPQRLCLQPLLLFLQLPLALHHRREGGKERGNGSWRAGNKCMRTPACTHVCWGTKGGVCMRQAERARRTCAASSCCRCAYRRFSASTCSFSACLTCCCNRAAMR